MRELRRAALEAPESDPSTQNQAARLLVCSRRGIVTWEAIGSSVAHAYSYVGLAFRLGGEERARRVLKLMGQLELEGFRARSR